MLGNSSIIDKAAPFNEMFTHYIIVF